MDRNGIDDDLFRTSVEGFRQNWQLIAFLFCGCQLFFLTGYLVLSDIPFLHTVDLTFMVSTAGQMTVFWMFFIPLFAAQFRINTLEYIGYDEKYLPRVILIRWPYFLACFLFLATFFFTNFNMSGFHYFISAVLVFFFLYTPKPSRNPAVDKLSRILKIYQTDIRRAWRSITLPYFLGFLRKARILLLMTFSAWLGYMRYDYVSEHNLFEYHIGEQKFVGALLGRNSSGLIFRLISDEFVVVPTEAIDLMKVEKSRLISQDRSP